MTTDQAASATATQLPPRRVRPLVLVAVVALVADVVSKMIAVATLEGNSPVRLLGGFLYLRLIRNPGAAFSFGTGLTWVFSLVMIAVSVAICWLAFRLRHTGWAVGLGLVLAGALGNLSDRMFRGPGPFRGHVVDFISLFSPNGHPWPIFNIADACINVGGAIIVIIALRGINYDGSTTQSRRDAANRDTAAEGVAAAPVSRPVAEKPAGTEKPVVAEKSRAEAAADRVRAMARARAEAPTMRVPAVTPPKDTTGGDTPATDAAAGTAAPGTRPDEDHLSGELPAVAPGGAEADEPTARIDVSAAGKSTTDQADGVAESTESIESTEDGAEDSNPPTAQLHIEQSPVGLLPILSADDDVRTTQMLAGKLDDPADSGDATGRMMAGKLDVPADDGADEATGRVPDPAATPDPAGSRTGTPGAGTAKNDDAPAGDIPADDNAAAADPADAPDPGTPAPEASRDTTTPSAGSDESAELCGVDDEATTQISLAKLTDSGAADDDASSLKGDSGRTP